MQHRKGMKIFRLESDWGEVIEGDANDLESLGFDSSMVRMAVSTQNPYRGYICSIVGIRDKTVQKKEQKKKTVGLDEFTKIANAEGKSYGELQLEESKGRIIKC